MKNIKPLMTSNSQHWATPSVLYKSILDHGYKDPCPLNSVNDGLKLNFYKDKLFINPPFEDLDIWVDYAITQYNNGCEVLILMPSRTDTKYFHKVCSYSPCLYFFKGRLHFNDSKNASTFPTCIVRLRPSIFKINLYRIVTMEGFINCL